MRLISGRIAKSLYAGLLAALVVEGGAPSAKAEDLKVRSPIIEGREVEFENNFVLGRSKTIVNELEYGFTDWLKLGVEGEWHADPGHGFHYDATALEAYWQLTPQGKYWADVALFAEYEHTARQGDPRSLTIGPLVQNELPLPFGVNLVNTANALFTKQMGLGSIGTPGLFVAAQSRLRLHPYFEPGFEYYGNVSLGEHGEDPRHWIGPAVVGRVGFRELGISAPGAIRYDAAYLRGLTAATEPSTFRVRFELEFPL